MRTKLLARLLVLLAVAALAIPVLAKPVSKSLTLMEPAKIGSTQLSVGDYRLLIDGNKVTVQQNNKVVAEVEGRWEERTQKPKYNSLLVGPNREVQEIRFAGDRRVLVLSTQ
jgi:hypothetical protein